MSKWFAANSDSDSSSSSSDSEDERGAQQQPSAFLMSDDEEETKRVVRSAREKRYEALNQIIKNIRNSKKIKDFTKMESGFIELTKAYEKAKPVVEKEENGVTPRFFIRILVELEDIINETWEDRDGRKKMSKNNSKSLGALRQKLRKYMKDFEEDVKKFQEDPDAADDEDEKDKTKDGDDMDSDAESDNEAGAIPDASAFKKSKSKSTTPGDDDDDESDDSYWDSDSDESSRYLIRLFDI